MHIKSIYLDNNATTRVMPSAMAAAQAAMVHSFGNPSSSHCAGLVAKQLLADTRALAAQVLESGDGALIFTSGATEGIQSAVFSALLNIKDRQAQGLPVGKLVVLGATEHKAVPECLKHWTTILGLALEIRTLPVNGHGQHDLKLLAQWMPDTALLCTMAVNNETGVVSSLAQIEQVLSAGNPRALWLVDCVQALGKLPLKLRRTRIDYATFSGHKLYGPKGIGLLYVRSGSPYTAIMAGGGQEGGLRAGTENMPGLAAFGAVMKALLDGTSFASQRQLKNHRDQLATALCNAFPGLVFNAPLDASVPTTLNFSVPAMSSQTLLALFDAAGVRVSAGSACSAGAAAPSYVLVAMGLAAWRTASAVRLSFGPLDDAELIGQACDAIALCGRALSLAEAGTGAPPALESLIEGHLPNGSEAQVAALDWGELAHYFSEHPHALLVDVREPYEHLVDTTSKGVAKVVNVPLNRLARHIPTWLQTPSQPLVFFCRTGRRSHSAALQLVRLGHANTKHVAGGLALAQV